MEEVLTDKEQIIHDIENTPIILFMKGTKDRPMCGFSARVVSILNNHSVVYQDVNILENPEIRTNLSAHSNWPTIPQLFVKGKLIGGCDIVMEMESKGKLGNILTKYGIQRVDSFTPEELIHSLKDQENRVVDVKPCHLPFTNGNDVTVVDLNDIFNNSSE